MWRILGSAKFEKMRHFLDGFFGSSLKWTVLSQSGPKNSKWMVRESDPFERSLKGLGLGQLVTRVRVTLNKG